MPHGLFVACSEEYKRPPDARARSFKTGARSRRVKVVAGSTGERVARALGQALKVEVLPVERKRFPDGEGYVRVLADAKDEDVLLVQGTLPDPSLMELLLLQDALHRARAASVTTVIPYYAYARQDRMFQPGESVSAQAVAELIELKTDRVVTVDPHKEHILGFFGVEAHAASCVPEIAEWLRQEGADLVLAPDKGALERAEAVAKALGADVDHLEKTRLTGTEVRMSPKTLNVQGRSVAIVDDLISTGGTIATAAAELKRQGAARVVAACTHGLFVGGGLDRILQSGCDKVAAADTLDNPVPEIPCTPGIVRALRAAGLTR